MTLKDTDNKKFITPCTITLESFPGNYFITSMIVNNSRRVAVLVKELIRRLLGNSVHNE